MPHTGSFAIAPPPLGTVAVLPANVIVGRALGHTPPGSEEIGKQRRLGGGRVRLDPRGPRSERLRGAHGSGGPAPGRDPALLAGDLVALLDHRHVDQASHRMTEQIEVLLPVTRRQRPDLHLLDGEREGHAVALAGRQLELGEYGGTVQAGGPRHVVRYLKVSSYCSRW